MSRIIFIIIIILLYVIWIIWPSYGWVPFFIIQILLMLSIINEYYSYKRITTNLRKQYPDILPHEAYWKILIQYGHAIYSPLGSESIAVSFSAARLIGWIVAIILLYLDRSLEAVICFANTFLLALFAGWLDPIFFMGIFGRKKPAFFIKANIIAELREFVHLKLPTLV